MLKEISIYIHIPFCQSKCPYCHFTSIYNHNHLIIDYLNALRKEMEFYNNYLNFRASTLYIGGGTPSILDIHQLKILFNIISKYIDLKNDVEITFEANPKTLNLRKLLFLKKAGVNRLSIGAQSFDNKELKLIGRVHSSQDINNTYKKARKAGFNNINLDLIFAIPNQTPNNFIINLNQLINLGPEHISLYNLTIDEGSKWHKNNDITLPDNDTDFKIYQRSINFLKARKYIHYEISNFAKKGYKCKHNTTYWQNNEFIGMGLSAHSFLLKKRYSQTDNLISYLNNPIPKEIINNIEALPHNNIIQDSMFLNLRLLKGLDINHFKNLYHNSPDYYFGGEIKELKMLKLIKEHGNHIKLTRRGLYLANEVFEKFI